MTDGTATEQGIGTAGRSAADRIVDAANELIGERGYAAMTTRALAERADVNEVTIFRLFGSKLGVLRALGERFMSASLAQSATAAPLPGDLRDALLELAMREVRTVEATGPAAMRLAFDAQSVPEVAELMGQGPGQNHAAMTAFFAEHQRRGHVRTDMEPEVIADAFFALTSTFVMSKLLLAPQATAPAGNEEEVRQLVDVLLRGIGTGE